MCTQKILAHCLCYFLYKTSPTNQIGYWYLLPQSHFEALLLLACNPLHLCYEVGHQHLRCCQCSDFCT